MRRVLLLAALTLAMIGSSSLVAAAATITVTNGADSGAGSLRAAIASASTGDTIIVPALTVRLTSGQLEINKSLTITGAGARSTIISGTNQSRVFEITEGSVSISAVTVTEGNGMNHAGGTAGSGGGILVGGAAGAALTLKDSAVIRSEAQGSSEGGGISTAGTLSILRSTISYDSAPAPASERGGGIDVELGVSAHTFSLTDSTVAHDSLANEGLGAGIYVNSGGAGVSFTNDTIDLDFAGPSGSALDLNDESSPTTIVNTIVLGGESESCTRMPATSPSIGHNLEDQNLCKFTQPTDHTMANALLGPLQANGGQEDTQLPATGSPVIDAGSNAACPETDERGVPRPQGAACDIGAVERTVPSVGAPVVSGISSTAATVTTSASTVFIGGSFSYRYGGTTAYGSSTPPSPLLEGLGIEPAVTTLTGLTPSTTYHVQLLLTTPDGVAGSSDAAFTTAPAPPALPPLPTLTSVHQTAAKWREGKKLAQISRKRKRPPVGTRFSFVLNTSAGVKLTFTQRVAGRKLGHRCVARTRKNAKRKICKRTVTVAALSLAGHTGTNAVVFQGLISTSKKLKPGRYTLVVEASNSVGRSAPARLTFTIVK